jgi:hypothetical protein
MSNYRNAALAGLAVACVLFVCLAVGARFQMLVSLVIAIGGGCAVLATLSRRPPALLSTQAAPVSTLVPVPQFQAKTVTDVRLPSAVTDYSFVFASNVQWLSSGAETLGAGDIAVNEIIRRAREFTERHDPSQVSVIAPQLSVVLGTVQFDPSRQVQAKADSVYLQLPPEDQRRLDEFARQRKEDRLLDYQRRSEISKRRYLRTDVFRDTGSAVVWWLAKHEDQPKQVADSIDVFSQLSRAVNGGADATYKPATPQGPSACFDAFLDSLDPPPTDDVRLTLTHGVARLVDLHDQKAADEMRRRDSEPEDGNSADGYRGYPDGV